MGQLHVAHPLHPISSKLVLKAWFRFARICELADHGPGIIESSKTQIRVDADKCGS